MKHCTNCGVILKNSQYKYCSNACQANSNYKKYIHAWEAGTADGSRGINTKNISKHIKHFLIEKFGEKCNLCGWKEKNATTGKVPLEIDHINGNSEDNREINLRIICPNCHSLSPNFRYLNKGHGRIWRNNKYLKNSTITPIGK